VWKWKRGDLPPQKMPTSKVIPRGMEDSRFAVDYFLKMFGQPNLELLLEQTNIQRVKVIMFFICFLLYICTYLQ
jgi:hypothetical protein